MVQHNLSTILSEAFERLFFKRVFRIFQIKECYTLAYKEKHCRNIHIIEQYRENTEALLPLILPSTPSLRTVAVGDDRHFSQPLGNSTDNAHLGMKTCGPE